MKTAEQRKIDEQQFHNEIFESEKRKSLDKYYRINKKINKNFEELLCQEPVGKRFLCYGCGMHNELVIRLAELGATCSAIDISDFAIKELRVDAIERNLSIDYQVMDAENLTYPENSFDFVFGSGILHHLDLEKSYENISRVLKPNGKAIFIEPLGHNPLINGFRNKTPEMRTEDEHPLLVGDFELAKKYFNNLEINYFYLTTLALPILFKNRYPSWMVNVFDTVDRIIFRLIPFLRKHAWQTLIVLSNPQEK